MMPPADYYPVTISTNETPQIHDVVERAAARFKQLNGHEVRIIRDTDIARHPRANDSAFLLARIWDLIPEWVDAVLFYERSTVPMRILPEIPECSFAAAPDHALGLENAQKSWPLFQETEFYFHHGVFVASRDTRALFEQCFAMRGQQFQLAMNLVMQSQLGVVRLPKVWNYGISIEDDQIDQPSMVSCRGMPRPWPVMQFLLGLRC